MRATHDDPAAPEPEPGAGPDGDESPPRAGASSAGAAQYATLSSEARARVVDAVAPALLEASRQISRQMPRQALDAALTSTAQAVAAALRDSVWGDARAADAIRGARAALLTLGDASEAVLAPSDVPPAPADALQGPASNLAGLTLLETRRLLDIADEQRLAIPAVTSARLIRALLAAPDEAARTRLVDEAADEIVDGCVTALATAQRPDLAGLVALTHRAVDAVRARHTEAALALATTCLDTLLREHLPEYERQALQRDKNARRAATKAGRAAPPPVPLDAPADWPRLLLLAGTVAAHEPYDYEGRDDRYNRHGVIHGANQRLYRPGASARALSLASAWLHDLGRLPTPD